MFEAQRLHASLLKAGLQSHVYRCNLLLHAYSLSGAFSDAEKLLRLMPFSNVVSYNTLLSAFIRSHRIDDAVNLLSSAPQTDSRSWNIVISGCAQNYRLKEAMAQFVRMTQSSVRPDNFTFAIIAPCCNLEFGKQVHAQIVKVCSTSDVFIGTNLVRMYAEGGEIWDAQKVFDEMPERDSTSWNTLISCYSKLGIGECSLELFRRFARDRMGLDEYTFAIVLNEFASRSWVFEAMQLHSLIIRCGFCFDRFISNALVNLYSKCGFVASAYRLFKGIFEPDVVSWTAMIAGFAQSGWEKDAMQLFDQMRASEVEPNSFTLGGLLGACASTNAFERGRQYHGFILKYGFESNAVVGSALVDLYSKCGEMDDALRVFQIMPERDIVSWNAMICGFAQNGDGVNALRLFDDMVQFSEKGIVPNEITFIGVLSACSHGGLVRQGCCHFNDMTYKYMIQPKIEHYTCMVDMLARAGLLEEAEAVILSLPFDPDSVMWGTLLGACRRHENFAMATRIMKRLLDDETENSSSYILLANMYASRCEWNDAFDVREMMRAKGAQKMIGSSWIEIRNHVHSFMSGEKYHPQIESIFEVLQKLCLDMLVEQQEHSKICFTA
ncbi:hypothetical protein AAC387_Pa02g4492 [Persea americana]